MNVQQMKKPPIQIVVSPEEANLLYEYLRLTLSLVEANYEHACAEMGKREVYLNSVEELAEKLYTELKLMMPVT